MARAVKQVQPEARWGNNTAEKIGLVSPLAHRVIDYARDLSKPLAKPRTGKSANGR
jgi:hypothetical protein